MEKKSVKNNWVKKKIQNILIVPCIDQTMIM
jgi:hypothetical protein